MRAILDAESDVIRDFEIEASASLEELHDAISQSLGLLEMKMASFISPMTSGPKEKNSADRHGYRGIPLNDKRIDKVFSEDENRLIYVYDFLHLWTFFIELVETAEKDALKGYPSLIFSHGEVPETPPEKDFSTEDDMGGGLPAEDDLDEDDYDEDQFY